jgi:SAM-dependent methyltransferase
MLERSKEAILSVFWAPLDAYDRLVGRSDALTPPRRLIGFVGGGDYRATGREFLRYFITLADLKPNERVLDVGSGNGRMATPLTWYLSPEGSYDGFDIVSKGVDWCTKHITPRFPNFRFKHADIYNAAYNPRGAIQASEFRFPYEDGSFDFAFLTSVFTHMLPNDVDRYTGELARVLAPGGRCLVTFFILNEESMRGVDAGKAKIPFSHQFDGYRSAEPIIHEGATAYEEKEALRILSSKGLVPRLPIHYGSWSGRAAPLSFQDIIIVDKPRR